MDLAVILVRAGWRWFALTILAELAATQSWKVFPHEAVVDLNRLPADPTMSQLASAHLSAIALLLVIWCGALLILPFAIAMFVAVGRAGFRFYDARYLTALTDPPPTGAVPVSLPRTPTPSRLSAAAEGAD